MAHDPIRNWTRAARGAVLVALAAVAAVAVASADPTPAAADEGAKERKCVDADAVYFGDARNWSKPAEVDMDAVFREIAEYKEIVEKKLDPSDPKYGVLLTKARTRFRDAVRAAAKDGGYDLVAKVGAVKGCQNVPVITADVIKKL